MVTLLWELRHDMEYFRMPTALFKIIVHRVAAEEFSHLSRRLHSLKSMDLTLPRSSPNIYVHQQRKESGKAFSSRVVIVCLKRPEPLVFVSGTLSDTNYKICDARIDYPGPYKFLKGRANKIEHIRIGTRGNEQMGNTKKILDVAIERGCPEVNLKLVVSGPREELHDDLMRSLRENGLVVTGGQVCLEYGKFSSSSDFSSAPRYLEFFVSENPAKEAG